MISQLPLESRLVIEVFMCSQEGQYQCIGLGILFLFDEFGMMKQGIQEINLWPLYKNDPRLSCMEQYWVNRNWKKECKFKTEEAKIQNNYVLQFAILYLKLEEFEIPVSYSVRNNKFYGEKYSDYYKITNKEFNISNFKSVSQDTKVQGVAEIYEYNNKSIYDKPSTPQLVQLTSVLSKDSMSISELDKNEKQILIICRKHYKTQPNKLLHFLRAIDWSDPDQVIECHKMLKVWAPLKPEQALPLLDSWMADESIRLFALQTLQNWRDDELALFLPQMTQALQFETQHYNVLIEFLLERSLKQPFVIGHELYWYLKSQLFIKPSYERYALILEQFLMVCGHFLQILQDEHELLEGITQISMNVKDPKILQDQDQDSRDKYVQEQLKQLEDKLFEQKDKKYCFAIDPRRMISGFADQRSKTMSSKKVPLLLRCINQQKDCKEEISYLYKTGDDLRQDILTLQLIKIMNKIWLDESRDLKMSPYKVTSIDDQTGIIEFVPGKTLESIQQENLYNINQIRNYLIKESKQATLINQQLEQSQRISMNINQKDKGKEIRKQVFSNYLLSCAAYSVTCYVLGIGDRHPGNIMLQSNGKLFHIDFGHFLGNFKKKLGINRERTAFVYTKEMHQALIYNEENDKNLEHKQYEEFKKQCCEAYNLIRKQSDFIINIFMMMLSAGMPELQKASDIKYLVQKLNISLTDEEAKDVFRKEIERSRNDWFRRLDNLVHNIKHNKSESKQQNKEQQTQPQRSNSFLQKITSFFKKDTNNSNEQIHKNLTNINNSSNNNSQKLSKSKSYKNDNYQKQKKELDILRLQQSQQIYDQFQDIQKKENIQTRGRQKE